MYTSRCLKDDRKAGQEKAGITSGIKQYYSSLQKYCRFIAKDSWDGDDLAQEAVLKAIRHYPLSEINSALLKKIAYHHWVDTLRKRKHEVAGIPENIAGIDDKSLKNSTMDMVELLIEKLTPKQTVIFILKEAFRYQSGEIAELLGTTETAAKATLHRAKKRLERGESLRPVGTAQDESEQQLLSSLLYESIQAEDPAVLIEKLSDIPSLASASKPVMAMHSSSPLSSCMMAA